MVHLYLLPRSSPGERKEGNEDEEQLGVAPLASAQESHQLKMKIHELSHALMTSNEAVLCQI